jgi:hypothetical protein
MIAMTWLTGRTSKKPVKHIGQCSLGFHRQNSLPVVALELRGADELPGHRLRSFKRPSTELNRGDRETSSCKARRVTLFGVQLSKTYR